MIAPAQEATAAMSPSLLFVTNVNSTDNIMVSVALSHYATTGKVRLFPTVSAALEAAAQGDGLLIMADSMRAAVTGKPQSDTRTNLTEQEWTRAQALSLRVYIEFPSALPVTSFASDSNASSAIMGSQQALSVRQTLWERAVVLKPLGESTVAMDLLHPHKHVDYTVLPSALLPNAWSILVRVAGYDNASLGLPPATQQSVLLAPVSVSKGALLVAATQLSHARQRRFAPTARWRDLIAAVLTYISGTRAPWTHDSPLWEPLVSASYSQNEPLPLNAERDAVIRGVEFYRSARLMPSYDNALAWAYLKCVDADTSPECGAFARQAPPYYSTNISHQGTNTATDQSAEGQLGIFEGLTSDIALDGNQPMKTGVRDDCIQETSAAFAVRGALTNSARDNRTAINLLSYAHQHSGYSQPWIVGGDPAIGRPWTLAGDAFGLLSWETGAAPYSLYYSDDNARALLGAVVTAGLLRSPRWHSTIAAAVLGNLRSTGTNGWPVSSAEFSSRVGQEGVGTEGWRQVYDSAVAPKYSPHYVSYIWSVFLWAHARSKYAPLYDRARAGLAAMMEGYPAKWIPTANGIAMQRARIILPLAFLVRVNDTAEHRAWLATAIDGLLTRQSCGGSATSTSGSLWCAFREELSAPGWGGATRVPNNDDYGDFEAPLNQENNDPVSDMLYTSNFALLGLHEAAAATNNATYTRAADALAAFLVRIQARSDHLPRLDGAFFRAFDFKKWEPWASDADLGWGAWSVETGWTQSWITTILGLRQLNTSVWQLGENVDLADDINSWAQVMIPPPPPPPPPPPCLPRSQATGTGQPGALVWAELRSKLSALCAPSPGKNISVIRWNGTVCADGHGLKWETMENPMPREGLDPAKCEWSRGADKGDILSFFGDCDVGATQVPLPVNLCA